MAMSPEAILAFWKECWPKFPLTPELEARFVAKVQKLWIANFDETEIREAIRRNQRLEDASRVLNEQLRDMHKAQRSTNTGHPSKPEMPAGSKESLVPSGSGLLPSSLGTTSPSASPLSGPAGGSAQYGLGLVRNPGSLEISLGDRCEHCGALMRSGEEHDC
jgi:hypothetical protein